MRRAHGFPGYEPSVTVASTLNASTVVAFSLSRAQKRLLLQPPNFWFDGLPSMIYCVTMTGRVQEPFDSFRFNVRRRSEEPACTAVAPTSLPYSSCRAFRNAQHFLHSAVSLQKRGAFELSTGPLGPVTRRVAPAPPIPRRAWSDSQERPPLGVVLKAAEPPGHTKLLTCGKKFGPSTLVTVIGRLQRLAASRSRSLWSVARLSSGHSCGSSTYPQERVFRSFP